MLNIVPIKAFQDNYIWLFHQSGDKRACVVDPGDAGPVLDYLKKHELTLEAILITHHHADHTGGVSTLLAHSKVPVYGPDSEKISVVDHYVQSSQIVELLDMPFRVIGIPGHTLDHIAYFSEGEQQGHPLLFCGDTLFAGGCGRVFEGSHEMMMSSLQKLAKLPEETGIYCAHEYTMSNLNFARAVSPDNIALSQRILIEQEKRDNDHPTLPSSLKVELSTNPFIRCDQNDIIAAAMKKSGTKVQDPVEVFSIIRQWKDQF